MSLYAGNDDDCNPPPLFRRVQSGTPMRTRLSAQRSQSTFMVANASKRIEHLSKSLNAAPIATQRSYLSARRYRSMTAAINHNSIVTAQGRKPHRSFEELGEEEEEESEKEDFLGQIDGQQSVWGPAEPDAQNGRKSKSLDAFMGGADGDDGDDGDDNDDQDDLFSLFTWSTDKQSDSKIQKAKEKLAQKTQASKSVDKLKQAVAAINAARLMRVSDSALDEDDDDDKKDEGIADSDNEQYIVMLNDKDDDDASPSETSHRREGRMRESQRRSRGSSMSNSVSDDDSISSQEQNENSEKKNRKSRKKKKKKKRHSERDSRKSRSRSCDDGGERRRSKHRSRSSAGLKESRQRNSRRPKDDSERKHRSRSTDDAEVSQRARRLKPRSRALSRGGGKKSRSKSLDDADAFLDESSQMGFLPIMNGHGSSRYGWDSADQELESVWLPTSHTGAVASTRARRSEFLPRNEDDGFLMP